MDGQDEGARVSGVGGTISGNGHVKFEEFVPGTLERFTGELEGVLVALAEVAADKRMPIDVSISVYMKGDETQR